MKWIVRVLVGATVSQLLLAAFVFGFARQPQPTLHSATTSGGRQRQVGLISSRSTITTTTTKLHLSNPFSSMIGDMADSLFGGNSNRVSSNSNVDSALKALQVSSWSTIRDELAKKQTPEEREFRTKNVKYGYGTLGSPLNKIRLYNDSNKEDDIQVTFYRDSASWCKFIILLFVYLFVCTTAERVNEITLLCRCRRHLHLIWN